VKQIIEKEKEMYDGTIFHWLMRWRQILPSKWQSLGGLELLEKLVVFLED